MENPYSILPVLFAAVVAVAVIGWGLDAAFTSIALDALDRELIP